MKNIKFKVYKNNKLIGFEWLRPSGEWAHSWVSDGKKEDGSWRGFCNSENMSNWSRKQYTGLDDKNGVEIYEGDIFEWASHSRGVVKKVKGQWVFFNENGDFSVHGYCKDGKVIGNTYKNPELLEEKLNEKTQAQIKLCEEHINKKTKEKIKEKIKALQKQLPGSTSKFKDYNTRREIEKLKRSLL